MGQAEPESVLEKIKTKVSESKMCCMCIHVLHVLTEREHSKTIFFITLHHYDVMATVLEQHYIYSTSRG